MRVPQRVGTKGSLELVQRLVNRAPDFLNQRLRDAGAVEPSAPVRWLSPRDDDERAEYRDAAFVRLVGHPELADSLRKFWPRRGPQWDALGLSRDRVLLVEAKAHVGELASTCAARSDTSRQRIAASLDAAKAGFGAASGTDWLTGHYQLANRLAHLWFLRRHGVDARLVLLQFTGNTGMPTDTSRKAYDAALHAAAERLGFRNGAMPSDVVHVFVDAAEVPG